MGEGRRTNPFPDYTDHWAAHAVKQGINLAEEAAILKQYQKAIEEMAKGQILVPAADGPSLAKAIRTWAYKEFREWVRTAPDTNKIQHQAFLCTRYREAVRKLRGGTFPGYPANPRAADEIDEWVDARYVGQLIQGE